MKKDYKSFTGETLEDAIALVKERFPESALNITRQALRNPNLSNEGISGAIGYKNGRPVAFQIQMPRPLYCGQERLTGMIGGMTCKTLKGCPLSVLLETLERSYSIADSNTLFFGNTCCAATSQIDESSGSVLGPESCTRYRYAVIRPFDFVAYVIRRKILKLDIPKWDDALPVGKPFAEKNGRFSVRREFALDGAALSCFWQRYMASNTGIVLSRTLEELQWLFGDRIEISKSVVLVAYEQNEIVGYIILTSPSAHARRWEIGDMIAIKNDPVVIGTLLASAKRFLRKSTKSFLLETIGFPTYIQKTIARHLPFVRSAGCNYFSYAFASNDLKSKCDRLINSPQSWFFGPYDGDMCMG